MKPPCHLPHYLNMFKFMVMLASCFMMDKAHNCHNVQLELIIVHPRPINLEMPLHSNFTLDLEFDSMFQQSTRLVNNTQETFL
jgi:hypothetical protein